MATTAKFVVCSAMVLISYSLAADDSLERALSDQWLAAYDERDADALGAIYADDAQVQHGSCPAVIGREAIIEFWRADLEYGSVTTQLEITDSFTDMNVAYIGGNYSVVNEADDTRQLDGRYTQIWRRANGSDWELYRESWINFACVQIRSRELHTENTGSLTT